MRAGGGGPEDPMLERRVEALESDVRDVKAILSRLEAGFARVEEKLSHVALSSEIARLEGRLSQIPSTWQIVGILAALLFGIASVVYATTNFIGQRPAPALQQSTAPR